MVPEPVSAAQTALPLEVIGPIDLGRLIRELDAINNFLMQAELRKDGGEIKLPKTSQLLDKTIELNHIDMFSPADRKRLADFLDKTRTKAPVLHISFSADPSPIFTQKLLTWLRREIHPHVLVTIGMQPTIGAGCIVRTTNKYFDFSLRQGLLKKSDILMAKIKEATAV